jgi:hypothetical protein
MSQDNGWKIANEFNVHNSGLGANRVNAIAISTGNSGETILWVGTPCGFSYYSYPSSVTLRNNEVTKKPDYPSEK